MLSSPVKREAFNGSFQHEEKMKFKCNGANCFIEMPPIGAMDYIDNALTYTDQGAVQRNRNRKGKYRELETVSCLDKKRRCFPVGLLKRVCRTLDIQNMSYEIEYMVAPSEPAGLDYPDWAKDHQKRLADTAVEEVRSIGQSPTGSGKTSAIAFFCQQFPEASILVIAHKTGIVKNNKKTLEGYLGESVGEYTGRKKTFQRITVATINSLYQNRKRLMETLADIDILVVDECHNVSKGMWSCVAEAMTGRSYSWGVSATPYRKNGDDLWMEGVLGPVKCKVTEQEMVDKAIIQQPRYCLLKFDHPYYRGHKDRKFEETLDGRRIPYYNTWNGKPHRDEIYYKGIVANTERNSLFIDTLSYYLNHPKRQGVALLLFQLKEQGWMLWDLAKDQGLPVDYADGETPHSRRQELIKGMRDGSRPAVIASKILDEGEDIPNLEFVGIAGGGGNSRAVTQQVGRVIRTAANALALDIYDQERWYLERNADDRQNHIQTLYPGSVETVASMNHVYRWIDRCLESG